MFKKKEKPEPFVLTFADYIPSEAQLAHEKTYGVYGTQYDSWVNPKIPRSNVLAKIKPGDAVDFRMVPWKNGHMLLCIHRKSGLDFAVLPNNVTYSLRREYYHCMMEGTVDDLSVPTIHVKVYQMPDWWD